MTVIETLDKIDQLVPKKQDTVSIPIIESLSENSILKLERVNCPEIGLAGAVAHWGQKFTRAEIDTVIAYRFGQQFVAKDTGFKELYRVPEDYTLTKALDEELMMVKRLVASTLEINGWQPEQVAALYFGGSPPRHPDYGLVDYGAVIAQATGLTHLNPQTDIKNYYLACDAGGRALKDALTNPNLQGKNVLVVAVEGLTKQITGFDKEKADPLSLQVFSDGAAAIGVVPSVNLTYLLGESAAVRDEGALAAVAAYEELIDPTGGLIQEIGNTTLIQLPIPPPGRIIWMKGWETTKLFLANVVPVVKNVYHQHRNQYPEENIELAVAHHASGGVNNLVKRKLKKEGISVPMNWVVNDGNSSGATTLIAFIRQMMEMSPGDHIMIISFGAGISIDVFVVKLGGLKKNKIKR